MHFWKNIGERKKWLGRKICPAEQAVFIDKKSILCNNYMDLDCEHT